MNARERFPKKRLWANEPITPGFLFSSGEHRRGVSRESKKDYLHFLYIARGSLSETQYFIHLARRLDYLLLEEADALREQTKFVFACLHGLIRAVEKEAGKLSKVIATVTSLIVIGLMRWVVSCQSSRSRWSIVSA